VRADLLDHVVRELRADLDARLANLPQDVAAEIREQALDLLGVIVLRLDHAEMTPAESRAALRFLALEAWPAILERFGLLCAKARGIDSRGITRVEAALAGARG
jgi:hypothetical protein